MDAIKEWLESGQDYNTGLTLLAKHSKNRVMLLNLSRKSNPEKLKYELSKLCRVEPKTKPIEKQVKAKDTGKSPEHAPGMPKVNPAILPDHLKKLWEDTAEKYRLARATHEQIKSMQDENQRAAHIELLENYREEIRANWDVIDKWAAEQKNPAEPVKIDENRINANRKYLSDSKKNMAKLAGAIRAKKLEAMQRRINELLFVGEKFDPDNQKELEELGLKFNE